MRLILATLAATLLLGSPAAEAQEQPTLERSTQFCAKKIAPTYRTPVRGLHCYPMNPDRTWWNCLQERKDKFKWYYVTCG